MNAMEEARLEIAETRAHLHDTAEELSAALSRKADTVKQRVSPAHYAREYPWAALGVAVGIGIALGISGAASSIKDKVADRLHGDGDVEAAPPEPLPDPEVTHEPGVRERIAGQIDTMLADGLRDFMKSVGS